MIQNQYRVPAWAVGFLENGTEDGLTPEEIALLKEWSRAAVPAGAILDWADTGFSANDIDAYRGETYLCTIYVSMGKKCATYTK